MAELHTINLEFLDEIIIGRVEPHIYAFTTETIPNYLKVGDTYRPIEKRLNEWRKYFPNLEKKFEAVAKVTDETYFRDYAVHYFLEIEKRKTRLALNSIPNIPYYSNEFFKDATDTDLKDAVNDIKNIYQNNESKYQYYRFENSPIPTKHTYKRTETYAPRPNQQETINNFKAALKKDRTNLLMYAVMRFGKSFTSMCCAKEMGAKLVIVVSAKADVKEEWKRTVESHLRFEAYGFLDSNSLLENDSIITEKLKNKENIVLFLTLQDLQGDAIKTKHNAIFTTKIDLLLIDESHFGARALEYGKVLKSEKLSTSEIKNELKLNETSIEELESTTKNFNARIRIHLSGTPYRILMNSEFTNDDIIAFYQFSDIADDQQKWDAENLYKDAVKEWDNPYYGFPQMIRFAFNPNESSRKKMEEMKKNGISYSFSELFKPKSIVNDKINNLHKKFIHEKEIIDLLKIIDGSKKDENLLNFLDYDKIKEGKMCRHIVCVLPYRASCDAFEALINSSKFKNLSAYKIINISGVQNEKEFKDTEVIKAKIKACEIENIKTITLTVNRMLTGSTVPEWDTMLYFKDTASPQEYDQAIFRLQNQYIKVLQEPNGDVVKFNMKPQTLLVDFNPNRLFQMQEQKAQIYNVNTDSNGNNKLENRIKRELEISPIIAINNNKIVQIEPADILDAVRKYASDRSVLDEATTISIDYSLLDIAAIKAEIEKQGKINSRQGIEVKPSKGDGDALEVNTGCENNEDADEHPGTTNSTASETEKDNFKGKFAMYYARILFFAFLTDTKLKSLEDIIKQMDADEEQKRIAFNLDLDKNVLNLLEKHLNPFILSELDYKIQNINSLANDTNLPPMERASNAMKKFSRLSDSEIITPEFVTEKIINSLPENAINNASLLLDIAAKQGEFVYAVYKKFGKKVANNFYSIPTSKIAYEFTRKVYQLLELDVNHIENNYTSYDLLKDAALIKNKKITINNKFMKFDVIVGNPPYQDTLEKTSDAPIYNLFMDLSHMISPISVLISPARFLFDAGKTPKYWNLKLLNDSNFKVVEYFSKSSDVFPDVDFKGGVAITLRDTTQNFEKIGVFTPNSETNKILKKVVINNFHSISSLIYSPESYRFSKTIHIDYPEIADKLSNGHLYDLTSNIFSKLPNIFHQIKPEDSSDYIQILGRQNNTRSLKWIKRKYIESHDNIDSFKVLLPKSNGTGALGEKLSTPLIGKPSIGHTQTFISIGSFNSFEEAENLLKYISTKFTRLLLGSLKVTQDNKKNVWKFVPMQDFTLKSDIEWKKPIKDINNQLYKKYNLSVEEIQFIEQIVKSME